MTRKKSSTVISMQLTVAGLDGANTQEIEGVCQMLSASRVPEAPEDPLELCSANLFHGARSLNLSFSPLFTFSDT